MQSQSPYSPPSAPLKDVRVAKKPGSALLAVLTGLGVDFGGTTIAGIIYVLIYTILGLNRGMTREQIEAAMQTVDFGSPSFLILTAVGLAFSFAGGLVCARMARKNELALGALLAGISACIGLFMGASAYSWWVNVVMATLGSALILGGAAYGRNKNART